MSNHLGSWLHIKNWLHRYTIAYEHLHAWLPTKCAIDKACNCSWVVTMLIACTTWTRGIHGLVGRGHIQLMPSPWVYMDPTSIPPSICLHSGGSLVVKEDRAILFSLFSMTPLENAKSVVLSSCRLLINMTNGPKLSYYRGNTKTLEIWGSKHIQRVKAI
jgi:hypothetical protein